MIRRFILVFAALWVAHSAGASSLKKGVVSVSSDPIITFLHAMPDNYFAQISSVGAGTDGSKGIANDELSCFTNNGSSSNPEFTLFDGSTNADGSYNGNSVWNRNPVTLAAGPLNPNDPCNKVIGFPSNMGPGATGGTPSWTDGAFSSESCSASDLRCALFKGGHINGGDGGVAWFDIKAAIAACVASPSFPASGSNGVCPTTARGHWVIPANLHSARYIPQSETPPSTPHSIWNTDSNGLAFTATFTICTNNCTITVSAGISNLFLGAFIGVPNGGDPGTGGVSHFVQVLQSNGNCNNSHCSGTSVVVGCPVSWQPCLTANETNISLVPAVMYYNVPNDTGNEMPIAVHTYWSDLLVPGTTKFIPGGIFPFASDPANSGNGTAFFVFDISGSGSVFVNANPTGSQPTFNGQGAPCYNPIDQNIYANDSGGNLVRGSAAAFIAGTTGLTTTVASGFEAIDLKGQIVCMTDPVNGAGHEAVFQEDGASGSNTDNGFTLATDVSGTVNVAHHTFGNTVSSVFATGQSAAFRKWIPSSDGTFQYVWEGGSAVYKVATPSNLANWTASEIDGGTATGALPQLQSNAEQSMEGFDLGAAYCHAPVFETAGDIYIYRPPGCGI